MRLLTLAGLLVLAVVAIRVWVEVVGPLPGERAIAAEFPALGSPRQGPRYELVDMFDLLGKPIFALAAVAVATWLVWRGRGPGAAAFVVLAAGGLVLNAAAKAVFGVTPLWREIKGPQALANYPSGHVFYAVVLGGALARLAWLAGRRDLVLLAAVPVLLMGPMRVLGGAHLAGDVLAGYLLGAAWLCVCVAVFTDGRAPWTSR